MHTRKSDRMKEYKKAYPQLDEQSFTLGYIAGHNDAVKKMAKLGYD